MAAGAPHAGHYAAAYERLRRQVTAGAVGGRLDRPAGGAPAGLGLVLERGVAGWLEALERLDLAAIGPGRGPAGAAPRAERDDTGPHPTSSAPVQAAEDLLPVARHSELTRVLASLVLSTRGPGASGGSGCEPTAQGGGAWR